MHRSEHIEYIWKCLNLCVCINIKCVYLYVQMRCPSVGGYALESKYELV